MCLFMFVRVNGKKIHNICLVISLSFWISQVLLYGDIYIFLRLNYMVINE